MELRDSASTDAQHRCRGELRRVGKPGLVARRPSQHRGDTGARGSEGSDALPLHASDILREINRTQQLQQLAIVDEAQLHQWSGGHGCLYLGEVDRHRLLGVLRDRRLLDPERVRPERPAQRRGKRHSALLCRELGLRRSVRSRAQVRIRHFDRCRSHHRGLAVQHPSELPGRAAIPRHRAGRYRERRQSLAVHPGQPRGRSPAEQPDAGTLDQHRRVRGSPAVHVRESRPQHPAPGQCLSV